VASVSRAEFSVSPPLRGPTAVENAARIKAMLHGPGASCRVCKSMPRPGASHAWFEVFNVADGLDGKPLQGVLFYAAVRLTSAQFGSLIRKALKMAWSKVSPLIEKAGPFKYASTQVQIGGTAKAAMQKAGLTIPSEDLGEDGRESNPHVTVQYGIEDTEGDTDDRAERLAKAVEGFGPITLELGPTRLFTPEDKDHVVFVSVVGGAADLRRLRGIIRETVDFIDTYPTYTPHATIAYVKPSVSKRYDNRDWCEGLEATVRHLVFTDIHGRKTRIPL